MHVPSQSGTWRSKVKVAWSSLIVNTRPVLHPLFSLFPHVEQSSSTLGPILNPA